MSATPMTLGERSSRSIGTAIEDVIVGVTTAEAARRAATANDAAIMVCQEALWLTPVAQRVLVEFLDRYAGTVAGSSAAPGTDRQPVDVAEPPVWAPPEPVP